VLGLLAFAVYDVLMVYAFFTIGSAWMWGKAREVPDALVSALGLWLPIGMWANTHVSPWPGLVVAASYAGLWRWASEREAAADDRLRGLREEERAAAEARLLLAPDDGAARLLLAQALEKEGRWAEALRKYEDAHALSDRMFSEPALAEARERLQRVIAEKRPAPGGVGPRRLAMRPLDWGCAAIAFLLLFWSPLRALGAAAALGFARWLSSAEGTARSSF